MSENPKPLEHPTQSASGAEVEAEVETSQAPAFLVSDVSEPLTETEGPSILVSDVSEPLTETEGPSILVSDVSEPLTETEGPSILVSDVSEPLTETEGPSILVSDVSEPLTGTEGPSILVSDVSEPLTETEGLFEISKPEPIIIVEENVLLPNSAENSDSKTTEQLPLNSEENLVGNILEHIELSDVETTEVTFDIYDPEVINIIEEPFLESTSVSNVGDNVSKDIDFSEMPTEYLHEIPESENISLPIIPGDSFFEIIEKDETLGILYPMYDDHFESDQVPILNLSEVEIVKMSEVENSIMDAPIPSPVKLENTVEIPSENPPVTRINEDQFENVDQPKSEISDTYVSTLHTVIKEIPEIYVRAATIQIEIPTYHVEEDFEMRAFTRPTESNTSIFENQLLHHAKSYRSIHEIKAPITQQSVQNILSNNPPIDTDILNSEPRPFSGSLLRFMSSTAMIDFLIEKDNLCDRHECDGRTNETNGSCFNLEGREKLEDEESTSDIEDIVGNALLGVATVMTHLASVDDLGPYQTFEKLTSYFTVRPSKSEGSHLRPKDIEGLTKSTIKIITGSTSESSASGAGNVLRSKSAPFIQRNDFFSGFGFSDMGEDFAREEMMHVPLHWPTTLIPGSSQGVTDGQGNVHDERDEPVAAGFQAVIYSSQPPSQNGIINSEASIEESPANLDASAAIKLLVSSSLDLSNQLLGQGPSVNRTVLEKARTLISAANSLVYLNTPDGVQTLVIAALDLSNFILGMDSSSNEAILASASASTVASVANALSNMTALGPIQSLTLSTLDVFNALSDQSKNNGPPTSGPTMLLNQKSSDNMATADDTSYKGNIRRSKNGSFFSDNPYALVSNMPSQQSVNQQMTTPQPESNFNNEDGQYYKNKTQAHHPGAEIPDNESNVQEHFMNHQWFSFPPNPLNLRDSVVTFKEDYKNYKPTEQRKKSVSVDPASTSNTRRSVRNSGPELTRSTSRISQHNDIGNTNIVPGHKLSFSHQGSIDIPPSRSQSKGFIKSGERGSSTGVAPTENLYTILTDNPSPNSGQSKRGSGVSTSPANKNTLGIAPSRRKSTVVDVTPRDTQSQKALIVSPGRQSVTFGKNESKSNSKKLDDLPSSSTSESSASASNEATKNITKGAPGSTIYRTNQQPPNGDPPSGGESQNPTVLSMITPFREFEVMPAADNLKQSLGGIIDIQSKDKSEVGNFAETLSLDFRATLAPNIREEKGWRVAVDRNFPTDQDGPNDIDGTVDIEPNSGKFPTDFVLPTSTVPTPMLTPDISEHGGFGFLSSLPFSNRIIQYDYLGHSSQRNTFPVRPITADDSKEQLSPNSIEIHLRETTSTPFSVTNLDDMDGVGILPGINNPELEAEFGAKPFHMKLPENLAMPTFKVSPNVRHVRNPSEREIHVPYSPTTPNYTGGQRIRDGEYESQGFTGVVKIKPFAMQPTANGLLADWEDWRPLDSSSGYEVTPSELAMVEAHQKISQSIQQGNESEAVDTARTSNTRRDFVHTSSLELTRSRSTIGVDNDNDQRATMTIIPDQIYLPTTSTTQPSTYQSSRNNIPAAPDHLNLHSSSMRKNVVNNFGEATTSSSQYPWQTSYSSHQESEDILPGRTQSKGFIQSGESERPTSSAPTENSGKFSSDFLLPTSTVATPMLTPDISEHGGFGFLPSLSFSNTINQYDYLGHSGQGNTLPVKSTAVDAPNEQLSPTSNKIHLRETTSTPFSVVNSDDMNGIENSGIERSIPNQFTSASYEVTSKYALNTNERAPSSTIYREKQQPPNADPPTGGESLNTTGFSAVTPFREFEVMKATDILKQNLGGIKDNQSIVKSEVGNLRETLPSGHHATVELNNSEKRGHNAVLNMTSYSAEVQQNNIDGASDMKPNSGKFPTDFILPTSTVPTPILTPDISEHGGFFSSLPFSSIINQYDYLGHSNRGNVKPIAQVDPNEQITPNSIEIHLRETTPTPFSVTNSDDMNGIEILPGLNNTKIKTMEVEFGARPFQIKLPANFTIPTFKVSSNVRNLTERDIHGQYFPLNPNDTNAQRKLDTELESQCSTVREVVKIKPYVTQPAAVELLRDWEEWKHHDSSLNDDITASELSVFKIQKEPSERNRPDLNSQEQDSIIQSINNFPAMSSKHGLSPQNSSDNIYFSPAYESGIHTLSAQTMDNSDGENRNKIQKPIPDQNVEKHLDDYQLVKRKYDSFGTLIDDSSIFVRSRPKILQEKRAPDTEPVKLFESMNISEPRPIYSDLDSEFQQRTVSPELERPHTPGKQMENTSEKTTYQILGKKHSRAGTNKVNELTPSTNNSYRDFKAVKKSNDTSSESNPVANHLKQDNSKVYFNPLVQVGNISPFTTTSAVSTSGVAHDGGVQSFAGGNGPQTLISKDLTQTLSSNVYNHGSNEIDELIFTYSEEEIPLNEWSKCTTTSEKSIRDEDVKFSCTLTEISNNDGNEPQMVLEVDGEKISLSEPETSNIVKKQVSEIYKGETTFTNVVGNLKKLTNHPPNTKNFINNSASRTPSVSISKQGSTKPMQPRESQFGIKNARNTSKSSFNAIGKPSAVTPGVGLVSKSQKATPSSSNINRTATSNKKMPDDKEKPKWK